jgi:ribose 5-phosphate isomerase B
MKIALVTDELHPINIFVLDWLKENKFEPHLFGSYHSLKGEPWVRSTAEAARSIEEGRCQEGIFFCWSGTGASMVANKIKGIRAALCTDAETAHLARVWNHANVLVLSNRSLSKEMASQILEAWFSPYDRAQGEEGVKALGQLEDQR